MSEETTIVLGQKAKDKVTGFNGEVLGICHYLYANSKALVQPCVCKKEGEYMSSAWIDIERLTFSTEVK